MFQRIFAAASAAVSSVVAYVRSLIRRWGWRKTLIGVGVVVVGALILSFISGSAPAPVTTTDTRSVEVRSVGDLTNETSGLSVAGTVSSKSEATVRAEKSGEVKSLNYELGDNVGAGAVVAEIENASERAGVLQAQAGVDTARASAEVSGTGFAAAQSAGVNALLSAYGAADAAVHGTADAMFLSVNQAGNEYSLRFQTPSSARKRNAEDARAALDTVLLRQKNVSKSLSTSANLVAELEKTEAEIRQVQTFFDLLLQALNDAEADSVVSESQLATYRDDAATARATIVASLSAIATAKQNLQNAETGSVGGSSTSAAAVKQAEAMLASARANLEHTIVRAPISGTINSLSLKRGDFAQLGSAVLTVANNNALEVVAYVTESDAREVSVGSKATLSGGIEGVVTRIAPAIDPATKKIEVRIGITGSSSTLVNGQSVTIELGRATTTSALTPTRLVIPLSALKIGVDDMVVYTVAEDSTLVAHPVVLGVLMGDRVEITEGLTLDMRIVVDARGLRPGEKVIVK